MILHLEADHRIVGEVVGDRRTEVVIEVGDRLLVGVDAIRDTIPVTPPPIDSSNRSQCHGRGVE